MIPLLTDPVVLICSGIIVFGLFGFVWGVGKFRRLGPTSRAAVPTDEVALASSNRRYSGLDAPSVSAAPPVSQEMADRLESMTQRLAEMQAVLAKQSAPGAADAGVGQGFSPETVDKLLKIIGNVMQQVDTLQKNLVPPKP